MHPAMRDTNFVFVKAASVTRMHWQQMQLPNRQVTNSQTTNAAI
jgi:hypothetical protein